MSARRPFANHVPSFRPRPYQQAALGRFSARVAEGRRRFYLVSPPGSGKTLLGLSMAAELGTPALALSPTTTIAQQWVSRLAEHWVRVDGDDGGDGALPLAACEPGPAELDLLSLTYQRVATVGASGELHDNVLRLHAELRRLGIGALLLDECHHLSQHWGDAVLALARALGDPFIIGLTATPLEEGAGVLGHWFGPPDHVISLPSVVRNGDLAPYQDLCHTVVPTPDESASIDAALGRFETLFQALCQSAPDRFSLQHWAAETCSDPSLPPDERDEAVLARFEREPDLLIAICRWRFAADHEPPVALPYAPELYEPVSLGDRLRLAAHYTREVLLESPALACTALAELACATLALWGYDVTRGRLVVKRGKVSETIGFSRQKLDGMAAILRTEMRHLGDDLRVLVLTDYEFPPDGSAALSCLDVMDTLTTAPELDELEPVLVTGTSLLVDDDLWGEWKLRAEAFARREGLDIHLDMVPERHSVRVLAEGGQAVGTTAAVRMATWLFEQGVCRCLIGTRALLGEGWDCRRLNTLIDLTVVTSGVSVNQLRGRSLRLDPDHATKVANNWDVLCVSAAGDTSDFDRIARRHEQLYGVTDDGKIERGVGHFHARFAHRDPVELWHEHEAINAAMHERAADRASARRRWRVGEPFADRDFAVLGFSARARGGARAPAQPETEVAARFVATPSSWRRHRTTQAVRWLAGILGSATILGVGASLSPGLAVAGAVVPLGWAALAAAAAARRFAREPELSLVLAGLAEILALASEGNALAPAVTSRQDGSLRVAWQRADPEQSQRLATALAELLGPLTRQRYVIFEPLRQVHRSWLRRWVGKTMPDERAFPVPRLFGNRAGAEKLLAAWRERRHPDATLVHTRSDEGAALVRRLRSRPALPGQVRLGRVWA